MSTEINIKKRITILEESVILTKDVNSIDFVGAGVNASSVGGDVTVIIPGSSGDTTYYLNQTIAQAPYKEFSSIVTSVVEQVVPLTVAGGVTSVIAEYQTPSGVPGTTQIPAGLWQFFLHFNAGSAGQNWIIRPTVLKRDLGGIETLLFTPDPEIVTSMNVTTEMYTSDGVFPATTLLTTDRIVVRISMQNTTGVSQTVNFRTEGSQHYSVGLTTLNQVIPTGAVTNVTGTAPVVSSGGTTPAISIPQADALTDGYLSSSDFAVFDAKVQSVTGLDTDNTDPENPIINISVDGTTITGLGTPASPLIAVGGIDGSGIADYVARWSDANTLTTGLIKDDGTNTSIGGALDVTHKLLVLNSTIANTITAYNSYIGAGNQLAINAQSFGAGTGRNIAVQGFATTNTVLNVGVKGITSGASAVNLGGWFAASGATNNYSLRLTDGTEGVGKVLTCITANGEAQWQTPASAISGSGTTNYVSKWTSASALGDSLIQDDGTTVSINNVPQANISLSVLSTKEYGFASENTKTTSNTYGIYGGATGVGKARGVGVYGESTGGTLSNIGTEGVGVGGTVAIGGKFTSSTATTNYSLQLQDGTEGVGKVLTSMTADGKAQWQTPASGTVTSVTGTAPVVSSGGTTPAISIPAATTLVNGYLTSTDWTTFDAKASLASPAFTGNPTAPTPAQGDNDTSIATTAFVTNAISKQPEVIQAAASDETTNLTTGTAKVTFRMPYAMTLTEVRASLSTAQTAGALLTVDINLNGVSVLGTKLTFDNTEKTTVTAATPATIVTSALTDDGEITVDIDTVGTAGARGLKITLIGTRA